VTNLDELLRQNARLTSIHVERWVARGLLRPLSVKSSGDIEAWSFEQIDVARARLLSELVDEVGLDDDTVETVVALIDQVHTLRGQLDLLARAIAEQPVSAREAIAAVLAKLQREPPR
jgi:chaperone modulatory protein CbpM